MIPIHWLSEDFWLKKYFKEIIKSIVNILLKFVDIKQLHKKFNIISIKCITYII